MGVVYQAEDLILGRQVALKFLPDALANDPEALARFQREARAASALKHPHICTVYELAEEEGRHFIVMELMDGQTLKYLAGGEPMPVERIARVGAQVADALAGEPDEAFYWLERAYSQRDPGLAVTNRASSWPACTTILDGRRSWCSWVCRNEADNRVPSTSCCAWEPTSGAQTLASIASRPDLRHSLASRRDSPSQGRWGTAAGAGREAGGE